ncbi:hypothetical protein J6590_094404 [Homalodisca vitripennis]|nr:hypothetical protein J6590_004196 [Homalodisca vitripennis]KAG8319318.1 hypothetical protein J6590_094404 [Homalodisca vitripennis]
MTTATRHPYRPPSNKSLTFAPKRARPSIILRKVKEVQTVCDYSSMRTERQSALTPGWRL